MKPEKEEGSIERLHMMLTWNIKSLLLLLWVDSKEVIVYIYLCSVKQKWATLESDPSRDSRTMYIRVKDDIISDIKFKTFGCGSAIATSSMVTEMVKGMNVDKAMKITRNDVADELDGLPPQKMHCSNLATDALQEAIKDYKRKKEVNK